jgi:hypothetical protein
MSSNLFIRKNIPLFFLYVLLMNEGFHNHLYFAARAEMRNNGDIKNFKEYGFLAFIVRTFMINFEIQNKIMIFCFINILLTWQQRNVQVLFIV